MPKVGKKAVKKGTRRQGQYPKLENRLYKEIEEIEKLIMFRPRLKQMELTANWEKSSLLSEDKNNLVRLGVIKAFVTINFWLSTIIEEYFLDPKKNTKRTKKYKIFDKHLLPAIDFSTKLEIAYKLIKIPQSIGDFLTSLSELSYNFMHQNYPGLENEKEVYYNKNCIYNLDTFKQFIKDASKTEYFLTRKATEIKI